MASYKDAIYKAQPSLGADVVTSSERAELMDLVSRVRARERNRQQARNGVPSVSRLVTGAIDERDSILYDYFKGLKALYSQEGVLTDLQYGDFVKVVATTMRVEAHSYDEGDAAAPAGPAETG